MKKHVLLCTALTGLAASHVQAADILVDGSCVLADAITAANTNTATGNCPAGSGSSDNIILLTDVALTAPLPTIVSSMTITGDGHFIDGQSDPAVGSILRIGTGGILTVDSATILGAKVTTVGGGGIRNVGGTVTLINTGVVLNTAGDTTHDGYGAGIYNSGANSNLTLTNSFVGHNTSSYAGGGIFNKDGTVSISGTTFQSNTATCSRAGEGAGGALANLDGTVVVAGSSFLGNTASYSSGGIHNQGTSDPTKAVLRVSYTAFNSNSVGFGGGAIVNNNGTATVVKSNLNSNFASDVNGGGGAMANLSGTLVVTDCTVSGNSAGSAGGISNSMNGTTTLNGTTVYNNVAVQAGGGLGLDTGSFVVNTSTIGRNQVSGSPGQGGGLVVKNGTFTLSNSTISENTASTGIGGGIANSGTLTLQNSLISGNTAVMGNEVYNTATISANSYNLFGHNTVTSAQALFGITPGANDKTATSDGTTPTALDAILSALANNGGPTPTYALPLGSPAIDLNPGACPNNLIADQRGYNRPINFRCDAGAIEFSPVVSPSSGNGHDLAANTWLMSAPSCMPDPADIATQYNSDIPSGIYGTNWIGYSWNAATQAYKPAMGAGDALIQGVGNWVYSTNAATLSSDGTDTMVMECTEYGMPSPCFAVDLVRQANAWNFVGHPYLFIVDWAQVKVAANNGSGWIAYSPSAAETAGYVRKTWYRWNNNAYEAYDDSTPGLLGTLRPNEAFWVRSLAGASGLIGLKLLIPVP